MKDILRTPDDRFENLPGFDFAPRYIENLPGYKGLRLHYIDEGQGDANSVFLCLHGEPTWSYLYRKMIPVFVGAGHRAVAMDFFGFGRSDKPLHEPVYTFDFHRRSIQRFIEHLNLRGITLVCQDWGGVLGLTLPMEMSDRFTRLIVMNTVLGTGDINLSQGFLDWRAWSNSQPDMDVAKLISRTCKMLSAEECAAYAAPFPGAQYKAGLRRFPNLIPDQPDSPGAEVSRRARTWLRSEWQGQTFLAVGMKDPVLGPAIMEDLRKNIRGCPPAYELAQAGHFVPEWGDVVGKAALQALC